MNAAIVSGIETVMARSNLRAELESADWVITGEGSFDRQSLYGKVVSGILKLVSAKAQAVEGMATQSHTHLAVLAGQVNIPPKEYQKIGITAAISSREDNMSLDYALENSRTLLYSTAQRFAKQYLSRLGRAKTGLSQ